ncbi:hypothetical protein ACHAXT_011946 [Thalassiosira profunda]
MSTQPSCKEGEEGGELVSILNHLDELHEIPLADVRNFCIIAHVDHGKSSLASRVLEYTGNLGRERQLTAHQLGSDSDDRIATGTETNTTTNDSDSPGNPTSDAKEEITLLDTLAVERERGITVKASAASMLYRHPSATNDKGWILLNMVDTPGHADFGMEVSKSLDSVEGAVLLFDSAQGVQAQTLSVYDKARAIGRQRREIGLHSSEEEGEDDDAAGGIRILPALTKVDMPSARPLEVALAVSDLMGFDPDTILKTSARTRIGIQELLETICTKVPPPQQLPDDDGDMVRAKVIDSWFETKRGVIALVRVLSGTLAEGDRISVIEPASYDQIAEGAGDAQRVGKDNYSVQEIGLVMPHRIRTRKLMRGQMGYVIAGLRDPREARPGAILSLHKTIPTLIGKGMALPPSISMGQHSVLYASVHPMDGDGFDELFAAVSRLALSDAGLEIQQAAGASSGGGGGPFLGPGLRCGFQGLLHVEVFRQRLEDEFQMEAIVTPPKVAYTIHHLPSKNQHRAADLPMEEVIEDLIDWPTQGQRFKVMEPMVDVRVLAPMEYAGSVLELIKRKRGSKMETKPIDDNTWQITSSMPWAEVVTDFHDELKSTSAGYASFDVSESDPPLQEANLAKVDIMLNGDVVDPLAFVCHVDSAQSQGRIVCEKLQKVLPRQQFVTVIQAKAGGKIIASERIRAYRKDVLTKAGKTVGGGDITRKKKLLEKQKKGKKRAQASGKVTLSQAAFRAVISRSG